MSTIIKFELNELRKLANDSNSCVIEKRVTQNLALQPWCLGNLKESIKHLLDYKIGKYDKEFDGILLSYKNLRILQNVGTIRNDNSDIHFQVQADYFIFKPYIGASLTGIVNKKSVTHLGILVHRVFNVVIPRPTEEPGNKWIGASVQEGQLVTFRIVVLDLFGALPYIRGELDESLVKLSGPDGDDIDIERKTPQIINVSYVDFDKTKPQHAQKQNGDGPHTSPTRSPVRDIQRKNITPRKTPVKNGKLNNSPTSKTAESDTSVVDKSKKRLSKILDADVKKSETSTKSMKKLKRNS